MTQSLAASPLGVTARAGQTAELSELWLACFTSPIALQLDYGFHMRSIPRLLWNPITELGMNGGREMTVLYKGEFAGMISSLPCSNPGAVQCWHLPRGYKAEGRGSMPVRDDFPVLRLSDILGSWQGARMCCRRRQFVLI